MIRKLHGGVDDALTLDDDLNLILGQTEQPRASISSRPLFIRVAESIVILAPIFQFGCLSASAFVLVRSCSVVMPKNGPPEAVSRIFSSVLALC